MSRRVCILVARVVLLIRCAQTKRVRLERSLERVPYDFLSSFIRQQNAKVGLFKHNSFTTSDKHLTPGALVLTSERLLVYMPPESLLPSCNALSWDTLEETYFPGRHLMYNHDGVLEEARFESGGTSAKQRTIKYTPLKVPGLPAKVVPFEIGKFYPLDEEELPFHEAETCVYPEEAASIAIETSTIALINTLSLSLSPGQCYAISGCPDDECKENRVEWTACLESAFQSFRAAVVDAQLKKNELKETLGLAMRWAIRNKENKFANHPAYDEIATAFAKGIIPKRDDPNSRSGAAFFYSSDKKYIAKRIRDYEYTDGLLALAADGMYSNHIQEGSALCPTYIGYQSLGVTWIVMRREQLPPEITELLNVRRDLTGVRSLFADVKPNPMVSDRLKFHKMLGKEFLENGFSFANLHGWDDVLKTVDIDFKFLQTANLVDYSFWIYGTLFDLPSVLQKLEWEKSMREVMSGEPGSRRRHPGCAYGCQNSRTHRLVDVTHQMGKNNRLQFRGATYKCCCAALKAAIFKPESPCVLVNMHKATKEFMLIRNPTGCGNLLGQGWHSSYHRSKSPANGKCLVGVWVHDLWTRMPHIAKHIISPEKVWYMGKLPEPRLSWRCGVVCVSIGDYLLHLGTWEHFENAALSPVYLSMKWSDYPEKMMRVLHSLQGSSPFGDDFVDAISSGMASALAKRARAMHVIGRTRPTDKEVLRF